VTKSMRRTVPVLGLLTMVSVLLVRLNPPETRYPQPSLASPKLASALTRLRARIGSTAPELTFRLVSDDSLRRLSEYRGKVVLLNVWVTGCGPCWAEMPALNALQTLHGSDRFAVIALTSSSPEQVRQSAEKRGVALPPLSGYSTRMSWVPDTAWPQTQPLMILIDGWVPNMAWPLTILIDATGRIREVSLGRRSAEWLDATLRGHV